MKTKKILRDKYSLVVEENRILLKTNKDLIKKNSSLVDMSQRLQALNDMSFSAIQNLIDDIDKLREENSNLKASIVMLKANVK